MQIERNILKLKTRLQTCTQIYFVGIGGIGMSALAKYYLNLGLKVAGYDKTLSNITKNLKACGAQITDVDNPNSIPNGYLDLDKTLVVYTPAIPKENTILNYLQDFGFELYKRADILGEISKQNFCFAVAGTHGKTTTSTMLGHILTDNGIDATAFLGGISENYHTNLIQGKAKVCVIEADEFDRSFLKLEPNLACITATDADHLDIYKNKEAFEASFDAFANKTSGQIFVKKGLPIKGLTFAVDEAADYSASNLRFEKGLFLFDVKTPNEHLNNIVLGLPGAHNVSNALAALAMANYYGVSLSNIAKSLKTFKGINRRFTYKINTENMVLVDDYAHHPTEINAIYNALRKRYPNKEILAVFQPHLFSRTRDFADNFASSLAQFDQLLLLDIYPARELPIAGITSAWLLDKIKATNPGNAQNYRLISKAKITTSIEQSKAQVVLFIGAGDIGVLVDRVVASLIKSIK